MGAQDRQGRGWTQHPDAGKPQGDATSSPWSREKGGDAGGMGGNFPPCTGAASLGHALSMPSACSHGLDASPVPGSLRPSRRLSGDSVTLWGSHSAGRISWSLAIIPPHSQHQAPAGVPLVPAYVSAQPMKGLPGQYRGFQAGSGFCQLQARWFGTACPTAPIFLVFPLNQRDRKHPQAQKDDAGERKHPN